MIVEHGSPHHATIADLFWPAFNFALFLVLVVRAGGPQIRGFFRERTSRLRDGLAAGARAREEAQALRRELERDLADLPALRERLKADLRATAEKERSDLLDAARRTADRIRDDAARQGDHEVQSARDTLRAETVGEVVRQATALLHDVLSAEDQERFVRDFITTAGEAP